MPAQTFMWEKINFCLVLIVSVNFLSYTAWPNPNIETNMNIYRMKSQYFQ